MKAFLFWSVFTLALLFGYSIETKILEDIQHISAIGYDYVDEHRMKGTAAAPFYPPGVDVQPLNAFFTGVGHNVLSILEKQQIQAQRKLATGRLQAFLISKELAKNGVDKLTDPLARSTAVGRDVHMAVVDGSAEELLTFTYPNAPTSAQYLSDFMEKTLKDIVPHPTTHAFLSQYDGFGQDPFLPILEKKEDHIRYKGLALFKDDQYAGALSNKDSYVFKLLYEKSKTGTYEIRFKNKKYISIENIRSKTEYKVSGSQDNPRVAIHVSMMGEVRDASSVVLKGDTLKEVEKEWSKEMTKRAEKIMKKFQELHVDPLGIGEKVRSHFRHFDKEAWKDHYPNVPVEFHMNVRIRNTGITE
ncbi:Ger(x)C family spore germination protein [Bacillus aerolatus]|uniref:Ger(X)C family spore germination protein n=1 Tax=Bacillus aerolatus TaxID=2653354 RepID=A0A6I1FFP1_9BACI|nr:Ger(x)C family spore germination protein [Bacillus aerolatus]KAB7706985.1 Ger(x)C family spore germination protein [Bacillus aerolatus]